MRQAVRAVPWIEKGYMILTTRHRRTLARVVEIRRRLQRAITFRTWLILIIIIAFAVGLAGCSSQNAPQISRNAVPPKSDHYYDYVDLQAGWRIRTIIPILKSGKFIVETQAVQSEGNDINLKASDDFIGYEIAYYAITARGDGVFLRLSSAEIVKDGKSVRQRQPLVSLFDLPTSMKYVRFLFSIAVSKADHNQAILAASSLRDLDELTWAVKTSPEESCTTHAKVFCSWIPAGIIAQTERRDPVRRNEWGPIW